MQIQTQHYRQILRAFKAYLRVMGYVDRTMTGAKVFLIELEQKGVRSLAQITSKDLKDHYAYLQTRPSKYGGALSPHTIQGYLFDIRQLLRWAEKTGQILTSPMAAMRFPTPPKSERAILSKRDIQQLYASCNEPVERLTLSLFYGCGLRASEGGNLNLEDVNAQSQLLYVRQGKGKKRRVIPLTKSIIEDIENYVHQQRPDKESRQTIGSHKSALALGRYGHRMQANSYRRLFKKLLLRNENIRPDVSLHSLRHSIATHLLADGMRIERVRDFLGHDCLETTQIYTRVQTDQL
jgi:integrase/recombinase XerD